VPHGAASSTTPLINVMSLFTTPTLSHALSFSRSHWHLSTYNVERPVESPRQHSLACMCQKKKKLKEKDKTAN
jgi:hypothetical protein